MRRPVWSWLQPCCDACREQRSLKQYTVAGDLMQLCCFCGESTQISGLVWVDPATVRYPS